MTAQDLLNGPAGAGWLVLSGGNSAESFVRASVLARAGPGPIAYLASDGDTEIAQRSLEDMESLGAPSGYLVEAARENDATLAQLLNEASIIFLHDGPDASAVLSVLGGSLNEILLAAHEQGAIIFAEGKSATAFGGWVFQEGQPLPALDWLAGVFIQTGDEIEAERFPQGALQLQILRESALALGPAGALELWGRDDVRITLGKQYLE